MLWPFKRNLSNSAFAWNFFLFIFLENDFFCFKNTKMIMSSGVTLNVLNGLKGGTAVLNNCQ